MRSCISCSCSFSILHPSLVALTVARNVSDRQAARGALLVVGGCFGSLFNFCCLPQLFACFRARIARFIRSFHDNLAVYTPKENCCLELLWGGILGTEWRTTVRGSNAVMSAFGSIAANLDSQPSPTPSQILLVSIVDKSCRISPTLLMERLQSI